MIHRFDLYVGTRDRRGVFRASCCTALILLGNSIIAAHVCLGIATFSPYQNGTLEHRASPFPQTRGCPALGKHQSSTCGIVNSPIPGNEVELGSGTVEPLDRVQSLRQVCVWNM